MEKAKLLHLNAEYYMFEQNTATNMGMPCNPIIITPSL
jgi:hypothetical protein